STANKNHSLSLHDALPISEISAHDAPLYVRGENGQWTRNPNSRTIDITRLNFEPKPFDQSKYFSEISTVKPSKSSQSVKDIPGRSEEHTTELQSRENLVCR